jgi:hypothetical protein
MDLDHRVNWWVKRVGAVDTIAVAFPGAFGFVADRLAVQDVLGFVNQSIVLCAPSPGHWASPIAVSRSASWVRSCVIATSTLADWTKWTRRSWVWCCAAGRPRD